ARGGRSPRSNRAFRADPSARVGKRTGGLVNEAVGLNFDSRAGAINAPVGLYGAANASAEMTHNGDKAIAGVGAAKAIAEREKREIDERNSRISAGQGTPEESLGAIAQILKAWDKE